MGFPSFFMFLARIFFLYHLLIISDKYQLGPFCFTFLVNFQLSVTNLILSGLPSIILSSLSFLTDITSATNFTVANKLSFTFSYFSTEDSFTPTNVNSDFIPSLFLVLIASEKFENILEVSKFFNLIKSPVAKELRMLS